MQKLPSQHAEPLIADRTPWQRLRRDGRRLAALLGFKPFGIALIILIVVGMWFDSSSRAVAQARKDHDETLAELSKMKTLAGMRSRIESGLKAAVPGVEQARGRALTGATLDEAVAAWRNDCQAALQAQNIMDATIALASGAKRSGALPVAALDVEFTAVPQQLLSIADAVQHAQKAERIAKLDLVPDMTLSSPRLHVKMRLEAPYFPPKGAAQVGTGRNAPMAH